MQVAFFATLVEVTKITCDARHWEVSCWAGFLQGVVANFVETEQLVEVKTPSGMVLSSFVQIRGSIPLLWSQVPNIKYKPTTRLAPKASYQPVFDRHIADLVNSYKVGLPFLQFCASIVASSSKESRPASDHKAVRLGAGFISIPLGFVDQVHLLRASLRKSFQQQQHGSLSYLAPFRSG